MAAGPKCDALLARVFSPEKSTAKTRSALAAHLKKVAGFSVPQKDDFDEVLEDFLVKPMSELIQTSKLSAEELKTEIEKTTDEFLASGNKQDFSLLFGKLKPLFLKSVVGDCPKKFELSLLESLPGKIEASFAEVSQPEKLKQDFKQALENFNKEMNKMKKKLTLFECNCRQKRAASALKKLPPFFVHHLAFKQNAESQKIQELQDRVVSIGKIILQIEENKENYLAFLDEFMNDHLTQLAVENSEGSNKQQIENAYKAGVEMFKDLFLLIKNSMSQKEISDFLLHVYHKSFTLVFGSEFDFEFFNKEICPENCELNFEWEKIRSQLILSGYAMKFANVASKNSEEKVELDENQINDSLKNLQQVFLFDNKMIQLISNYSILLQYLFLVDSPSSIKQAKLILLEFFNEKINETFVAGPQNFDKFLDERREKLNGLYHLFKVWNLISFANDNKINYNFEWLGDEKSREEYKSDYYKPAMLAINKIQSSPKNTDELFELYKLKDNKEEKHDELDLYKKTADLNEFSVEDQQLDLALKFNKKRKIFSVKNCQEEIKEEIGDKDVYLYIVDGKPNEVDENQYKEILEKCKKPKQKLHNHLLIACEPKEEESETDEEKPMEELENFFFVDAEGKRTKTDKDKFEQAIVDCLKPPTFTVETLSINNCELDSITTEHKGRPQPDQPLILYEEVITGKDNEVIETNSLTAEQYEKIIEECKKKVTATTKTLYLQDCQQKVDEQLFKRKLPSDVQEKTFNVVGEEESESKKNISEEEYEKLLHDCLNPPTLTATTHSIDSDCKVTEKTEEYKRKFPQGIDQENYFIPVEGEMKKVTEPEYKAFDAACDEKVFYTNVHTVDDDCNFGNHELEYKRTKPADYQEEKYSKFLNNEDSFIEKSVFMGIKYDCEHPAQIPSTTYVADEENCAFNFRTRTYNRKLPEDVLPEYWVKVVNGDEEDSTKEEYDSIKNLCDNPEEIKILIKTIDDDNCEKEQKEETHRKKILKPAPQDKFFIKKSGVAESATPEQYEAVRKSCDEPETVLAHEHSINDDNCEEKTDDVPYKRRLPADVKENSYFIIRDNQRSSASFEDFEAVQQSCKEQKKINVVDHITVNCEFFSENREFSRKLPKDVEEVNYFTEEFDGSREKISEQKYNEIKEKCDQAKPITAIEGFKKTKNLMILDKCKVTFHVPTGKVVDGKPEQREITFIIISGSKMREVQEEEFEMAKKQCSFHGADDKDILVDVNNVPKFSQIKHILKPDCSEETEEDKYEGEKPADFHSEIWIKQSNPEQELSQETYQQEKESCLKAAENKITPEPKKRNEIEIIRGGLPEEDLDKMRDATEFVDHLTQLRTMLDLATPDQLNDDDLVDYLKANPMIYDPVNKGYVRITFVQVAHKDSDCLAEL